MFARLQCVVVLVEILQKGLLFEFPYMIFPLLFWRGETDGGGVSMGVLLLMALTALQYSTFFWTSVEF